MSKLTAMPDQLRPVKSFIAAILVFETLALFVRSYLQVKLRDAGLQADDARYLSYLIVPVILGVALSPILRHNRVHVRRLFCVERLSLRLVVTAVTIGLLARIAWWSQLLARISFGITRNTDSSAVTGPEFRIACPGFESLMLGILVMSILVPIIEEIINRGLIQASLMRHGRARAIIVSAFLFGVFHPVAGFPFAFIFGIVFGIQFASSRTLWASMITHASYNALVQFDWRCLRGMWNPGFDDLPVLDVGFSAMAALLLAVLAIAVLIKGKC